MQDSETRYAELLLLETKVKLTLLTPPVFEHCVYGEILKKRKVGPKSLRWACIIWTIFALDAPPVKA